MNATLRQIWRSARGLFVDDGNLALFAVILIVLVAGIVSVIGMPPLLGALVLFVGVLAILGESLMRATRGNRKR